MTLKIPLENIGQVTLKPMDLSACRQLTLNADASQGAVRVEVLDGDGYRIRGYTKEDAVPIRGDDLRHAVRWQNRGLPELPKGKYMLRLHLENAAVFALGLPIPGS